MMKCVCELVLLTALDKLCYLCSVSLRNFLSFIVCITLQYTSVVSLIFFQSQQIPHEMKIFQYSEQFVFVFPLL